MKAIKDSAAVAAVAFRMDMDNVAPLLLSSLFARAGGGPRASTSWCQTFPARSSRSS